MKKANLIILMAGLCLFAAQSRALAEGDSGVVKPRITIIKPTTVGEPGAGAGGHEGHAPERIVHEGEKPVIEDYLLPVKYSTPYAIIAGEDGIIWFTEMSNHSLGRLDPATGELKEYRLPSTVGLPDPEWDYDPNTKLTTPKSYDVYTVGNPGAITADKNGMIWFVTLLGNSLVRFDPAKEEFTEFILPTNHAQPYDVAADPSGRIWFVEKNSGKMGYLDPAEKKMMEVNLGEETSSMGIAVDKNGAIWIGDVPGNRLAKYDPATKKLKTFPVNVPNSQPGQMRFDASGNLWVCMLHSQQLGVLIPEPGVYSVVPLPGYNAVPQAIAPDAKGRIWIVDSMTNQIGFFDSVNLKWRLFEIPSANSQPMGVAVDKAGDIWFTQSDRHSNKVSRLRISSVKEEPAPAHEGHSPSGVSPDSGAKQGTGGGLNTASLILLTLAVVAAAVGGVLLVRKFRP